jgi:hypothetical protein
MSRTYRRKNVKTEYYWVLRDNYVTPEELDSLEGVELVTLPQYGWFYLYYEVTFSKDSIEGKKKLAKYHSDTGTIRHKEPGPSWFRNLYTERPLRRRNKKELNKFLKDSEYDPMCDVRGKLEYWT